MMMMDDTVVLSKVSSVSSTRQRRNNTSSSSTTVVSSSATTLSTAIATGMVDPPRHRRTSTTTTTTMLQEQQQQLCNSINGDVTTRTTVSGISSRHPTSTTFHNNNTSDKENMEYNSNDHHNGLNHSTVVSNSKSIRRTTTTATNSNIDLTRKQHRHHKKKKKRRRSSSSRTTNHNNNSSILSLILYDESFIQIFLRVGCIVCFVLFIGYQSYHQLYNTTTTTTIPITILQKEQHGSSNVVDVDDDTTNYYDIAHPKSIETHDHDNDDGMTKTTKAITSTTNVVQQQQQQQKNESSTSTSTSVLLVVQQFDAYTIADLYQQYYNNNNNNVDQKKEGMKTMDTKRNTNNDLSLFWQIASGLRKQFIDLYGTNDSSNMNNFKVDNNNHNYNHNHPINQARSIYDKAITTPTKTKQYNNTLLPDDIYVTACRIYNKKHHQYSSSTMIGNTNVTTKLPKFMMSFGGYSVTTGRGNLYQQSYPMVLQKQLLETIFLTLGIELHVINAAIGGCPSFPYGFCTSNFWGDAPDVVSWDYSMNEAGGDPIGLEAYIRHIITQYPSSQPKLIIKDTYMAYQRRNLIQYYYNQSQIHPSIYTSRTIRDPVIVHTDVAVKPYVNDVRVKESDRPIGFQDWRKFGTPINSPGQSIHHPAIKEHEFIAWIIAMHMLSALEVVAIAEGMDNDTEAYNFLYQYCPTTVETTTAIPPITTTPPNTATNLPEPLYEKARNSTDRWNSIMFGQKSTSVISASSTLSDLDYTTNVWNMNMIRCRTSFEPIVSGTLSDIIVSGGIGEDLDVMLPKSRMYYNTGWVLDLSDSEKKAKRSLDRIPGHGFVDSKKAYYGTYTSGALQLFLPYEEPIHSSNTPLQNHPKPNIDDIASNWYKSIVLCEVNDKQYTSSLTLCNSISDVHYTVGGTNITSQHISNIDTPATVYYGKRICTHIVIPETATLTTINELMVTSQINVKRRSTNIASFSLTNTLRGRNQQGQNQQQQQYHDNHQVGLLVTLRIHNKRIHRREDACSISHVVWEQTQPLHQE